MRVGLPPEVMTDQDGVVSRAQLLAEGFHDNDIERLVRRRELARIHPGVYLDHTGPPSWQQRAWAAVLHYWPAALWGRSVWAAEGLLADPAASVSIHVAVSQARRVREVAGVRVHRVSGLDRLVQTNRCPPRLRLDHSILDVASSAADDAMAIATLADACQSRRTTAARLAVTLRGRPRLPRRRFLQMVLDDVATGTYSVLEHRYLTRVERAHGLPTAHRQQHVRTGRCSGYRDVEYRGLKVVVELDGRLGHEWAEDRWDDLERDVDTLAAGVLTIRAGWRQVLQPCRLAWAVGRVLMASGWEGAVRPCGPQCGEAADIGGSPVSAADDAPTTGNSTLSRPTQAPVS